jgi:hypothetical protein
MAEQAVQMTAHCPKNIVQFKSTMYVLMMHQVDLFPMMIKLFNKEVRTLFNQLDTQMNNK